MGSAWPERGEGSVRRATGLFGLHPPSLISFLELNDNTEVKSLSYQSPAQGGNAHIPHMDL